MLLKIRTLFLLLLAHTMHALSFLFPRNKRIWIFIGGHNDDKQEMFADNCKYMFLYCSTLPHIRSIWIAQDVHMERKLRNQGYESYYLYSFWGIFYSLHAGLTFIDAFFYGISWKLSGRTKTIQLWHGKSLEKAGRDKNLKWYQNRFMQPEFFATYYATVASSKYLGEKTLNNFTVQKNRVYITGLPCTDVFFQDVKDSDIDAHPFLKDLKEIKKTRPGKYILYAPKFRRWEFDPMTYLNVEMLSKELEKHNAYLYISLHSKRYYTDVDTSKLPRTTFIKNTSYDMYPYLDLFDAVIADYGGITMDFVLLNKPTFFYVADIERYKKENGLYDDFEKLSPGPLVKTTEELLPLLFGNDTWKDRREEMRKLFFEHTDGNSAKRIVERLTTDLKI